MKKSDLLAVSFMSGVGLLFLFFPLAIHNNQLVWKGFNSGVDEFGQVTKHFPYIMGFIKVAFLATFGEMLKNRMRSQQYSLSVIWLRFIIWGIYGMLFTIVFALFANGVVGISQSNLWFDVKVTAESSFVTKIGFALSVSFWMNIIFGFPMMISHEWINQMIHHRRLVPGSEFMSNIDGNLWGGFIPKTIIFFWIPAHTVTFLLPKDFRVLVAALLSVALGFILSLKPSVPQK